MSKYLFNAAVIIGLILLPGTARAGELAPPPLGGEVDLGLLYLGGVTEKRGLDVSLQASSGTVSGWAQIRYAQEEEDVSENGGHARLGYDPKISERWSLWFFDQLGYDEMRKVIVENFAGGGPKYSIDSESLRLESSLSVGILQHHTEYEHGLMTDVARLSLRPKVSWQISDNLSFRLVAFYQPNVEDFEDYIIIGETSLKYNLTKKVGYKLKVRDEYRSIGMVDEKNNLTAVLGVSINF